MTLCIFCETREAQTGQYCSDECKSKSEALIKQFLMSLPLSDIQAVLSPISDDPEWQQLVTDLEYITLREN